MGKKLKNRKGLPMDHIKALKELTEMDEVKAENARLKAQLAEAREDAERYRWIRENYEWRRYGNLPDEDSYAFVGCRFSYLANFECKPMLDYNIDQMRKAFAEQGGESEHKTSTS